MKNFFIIKFKINRIGSGGHDIRKNEMGFYSCQIWTGLTNDISNKFMNNIYHLFVKRQSLYFDARLLFLNNDNFLSDKEYKTIIGVIADEKALMKYFYLNKKIEIRIGHMYDGKHWAVGEIISKGIDNKTKFKDDFITNYTKRLNV